MKKQNLAKKQSQQKSFKAKNSQDRQGIWLYGKHSVFLALQKKRRQVFRILITKNFSVDLQKFLEKNNLINLNKFVEIVDVKQISGIVGENSVHQGIALNCSTLPLKSENDLFDSLQQCLQKTDTNKPLPTLLIMDQIYDPHNVGAIIRSACAFGVQKIIFPEHNFSRESAIVNKASAGMIENVDLFLVGNLNNLLVQLKKIGYWCIGLAGEAKDGVEKIREYKNLALIIGNEGDGIRDLVKKNCDLLLRINIDDQVESLNASVAAAIALYNANSK